MTDTFDLEHIKSLTFEKQKKYIKKFFIPLNDGNHIILGENGTFEIIDQPTIKKVYFNRLNADLNKFYFNEYNDIIKIVCELNKPRRYDKKFNVCPSIKSTYKPYDEFSNTEKEGVETMLNYIKEVLASDNEECYIYIVKWLSNMLKGNRNDTCIYLKGEQGIGKSTLGDFLKEHVIGKDLLLESGSGPLKSQFNKVLMGKLCVVFEELENFGVSEWSAISSTLKRYITSNTYAIEAKNKDVIQVDNINNYILNSNNDAIRDDEGRRYFIADVNHKYMLNKGGYFTKLRNKSFNDTVGSAFYSYMLEYDTTGFIPQQYPDTKSKLNSISKKLDPVCKFLKDNYILTNSSIFKKPKELYHEYVNYCNDRPQIKMYDLMDFKQKLSRLGFEPVIATAKRTNYYKITIDELNETAKVKKWIHENDLEDIEIPNMNSTMITIPQEEYLTLLNRIKELEEQLKNDDYTDNESTNTIIDTSILEENERKLMEEEDFDLIEIEVEVDEDIDEDDDPDEYENEINKALDIINGL